MLAVRAYELAAISINIWTRVDQKQLKILSCWLLLHVVLSDSWSYRSKVYLLLYSQWSLSTFCQFSLMKVDKGHRKFRWVKKKKSTYKPSRSSGWQLPRLQCSTKRLRVFLPTLNGWNGGMLVHHRVTTPALNSLVPSDFVHLSWESEALRVKYLAHEDIIMPLVSAWIPTT